jgi:hypothetical protein
MSYSKTPQGQYVLERTKDSKQYPNPYPKGSRVVYTGSLKQKPTGWKVVKVQP